MIVIAISGAASFAPGPTSGTFVAAELTFDVTANVSTDGDDVFSGAFNIAEDGGSGDNANAELTPVFGAARVNQVSGIPIFPSPWLTLLLVPALAAFWAHVRSSR